MAQNARTAARMGATGTREPQMPSTDQHPQRNAAIVAGCLIAAATAAVVGVVLLTGGDDEPLAMPATPSATTAASPSPAPSLDAPAKPEDVAAEAARAKFLEYVRVRDRVAQGGYKNLPSYDAVAIDPERTELTLEARRTAAVRATGDSKVATLGVESVKLSADSAQSYSEVRLSGCLDVQGVEAFKADGTSAVADTRLPRISFTALVQMVPTSAFNEPGRAGGWYVAQVEYPGGGTAC